MDRPPPSPKAPRPPPFPPFPPGALGSKLPPLRKNAPLPPKPRVACAGAVVRPTANATPAIARTAAPASAMSIQRLARRLGGWLAGTTGAGVGAAGAAHAGDPAPSGVAGGVGVTLPSRSKVIEGLLTRNEVRRSDRGVPPGEPARRRR